MLENLSRWLMRLLALAAGGVAGYLFALSLAGRGLPPGCGAGSGCAEVLTSRWSAVFGIPVSAPAALLYLAVFVCTFLMGPKQPPAIARRAWMVLFTAAAAIGCAAMWFIAVQAFILQSFCIWCMTDHLLGLMLAAVILWKEPIVKGARQAEPIGARMQRAVLLTMLGTALTGALVLAQIMVPYKGPSIVRLPPGENADTGPGPDRRIAVLDGKLQLVVRDEPRIGSPDAPKIVVVMFDYCCPHCRRTHEYLLKGLARYPDQFSVLMLPMPLDADCNPTIEETEPRFEHACDLAKLALAVWQIRPEAYEEFDRWLFELEMPRELQEARAKAEQLLSASELHAALADPAIDKAIARHVTAYQQSGVDRLPIIMSPGFASIVGRPESEEQLFDLFEKELGLKPQ